MSNPAPDLKRKFILWKITCYIPANVSRKSPAYIFVSGNNGYKSGWIALDTQTLEALICKLKLHATPDVQMLDYYHSLHPSLLGGLEEFLKLKLNHLTNLSIAHK